MQELAAIVGGVAATLSVTSFAPQVWKVIKTRKVDELATGMWLLNVSGFALWTVYGVLRGGWTIIVPNVLCGAFAAFILVMKLVSPPTRHTVADALDPSVKRGARRDDAE